MDIYQPAEDSYLLEKNIKKYAVGRVLDLGTGSGILALSALKEPNVREVVAVDINEVAVEELQQKVKNENLRKIKVLESDLFSNVQDKFNLIIFNPPYLPQDEVNGKKIKDAALYGGLEGWELSERFFRKTSKYLFPDGKILFLFSSLTKKGKIDELIKSQLFDFKVLSAEKLHFEELYVYLIEKSVLLRELEAKGIEHISYLTHGKRGNIFIGEFDKSKHVKSHFAKKEVVKVAIKVKREESKAMERVKNEVYWLKKLNRQNIGPKLLFYSDKFFAYEYVEGEFILDWIGGAGRESIRKVLCNLLEQCFMMDELKVNKEEMHHPLKHIVVTGVGVPIMLDFERCNLTDKPQNVTQFVEFIGRMKNELASKKIKVDVNELRDLAKKYKENINQSNLENIKKIIM